MRKVVFCVWISTIVTCGIVLLWTRLAQSSPPNIVRSPALATGAAHVEQAYAYHSVALVETLDGVGDSPYVFASNPHTGLTYVANNRSDDFSVISGTEYIATISTNPSAYKPNDIAVNPTTGYAYALGEWNDTVQILSGTAHMGSIDLSHLPDRTSHVAVDSVHNIAYITHERDDVTVIQGTDVITTVHLRDTMGWGEHLVAVNPTRGLAYVFSHGSTLTSSTVFVLSGTQPVAEIPLESWVGDMAVDAQRGYVYLSGGNTVHVLSGTTYLGEALVGGWFSSIAVEPTSGRAYVLCQEDSSIYVLRGMDLLDTLPLSPYRLSSLQIDPSSGYLYAALYTPDEYVREYVAVYSGTTQLALLKLPRAISHMGADGRGHVYVGHTIGDFLTVLQGTEVLGRIASRPSPADTLADPNSGHTYIANGFGSDTVSVLSGTEVLTNVQVCFCPTRLARLPQEDLTYVGCQGEAALSILQGHQPITTTLFPGYEIESWYPPLLAADLVRGWVYLSYQYSTMTQVFSGTEPFQTIPFSAGIWDLAVDQATGHLLVAHSSAPPMGVTVLSGTEVITEIVLPNFVYRLLPSPVNGYVYAQEQFGTDVYVLRHDRWVGTLEWIDPNYMVVNPTTGYLYVNTYAGLLVISGSQVLDELPADGLQGLYSDVVSDRVYGLQWADIYENDFRVWRGLDSVGVAANTGWTTRICASPGGRYVYLLRLSGLAAHRVHIYEEGPLSHHFFLPLQLKGD